MSAITFQQLTASLISTDTGSHTQFSIENDCVATYYLYWIDRIGVEQAYGEVTPGETYNQPPLSSHVWEVKTKDGQDFKFSPTSEGKIIINADATETFVDASEQIIRTAHGFWSTEIGYGLINGATSQACAEEIDKRSSRKKGASDHVRRNAGTTCAPHATAQQ
jgi:hypothetical protein